MQATAKPRPLVAASPQGCATCSVASSCAVGGCGAGASQRHSSSGPSSSSSCSSSCSSAAASPSSSSRALPVSQSQQLACRDGVDAPCSNSSALKGRARVRMLEQPKNNQEHRHKQEERDRKAVRRIRHGQKKKQRRAHLNLSAKILAGIAGFWVLATTLLLTVPESQGFMTYLHWVRWPIFRDLTDLISFRLPHARNIRVKTSDGLELGGWHVLPSHKIAVEASRLPPGSRAREDFFDLALARPNTRVVIYFHGNAATRGQFNRVELVKALAATMEAHVIAIDYRGFGDSTGSPSEAGLGLDARAVWTWVQEKVGGKEGEGGPANIYLYGHSLGSGVALGLAHYLSEEAEAAAADDSDSSSSSSSSSSKCSLPVVPTGLILDAPFTNLSMAALHHPSALPFRLLPFVKNALLHSMHERFPSLDYIQKLNEPILILHGRRDRMIPFFLGQELYHAAQLARVRRRPDLLEDLWFSEFQEAGHNDVYAHGQWTNDVAAFMSTMELGLGERKE
ncbi:monoacylglycerol lipase abhd12 [Nannochloropsis oceanica]